MNRERQEQDLKDEIAFHLNAEVERRVAAGEPRADALASAKRQFGNVTLVEEVTRETWGWSLHDYKLGIRMLAKYPGLTIAGGLALAIAIGIGAAWYDISRDLIQPTLPLQEGERIVEIRMHDARANERERRVLHDFLNWRRDVRSIDDLGAYRTIDRNLIIDKAAPELVSVAEMTASGFRLARVSPFLGRTLVDADERPGAPDVVVLGYGIWQRLFGGRIDVIGRTVQLGRTTTTVVGVMPEGFAFPINHRLWVPLRLRPSGYAPLESQTQLFLQRDKDRGQSTVSSRPAFPLELQMKVPFETGPVQHRPIDR